MLALDENGRNSCVILSFDVATEGFQLIPMLDMSSSIYHRSLSVYENKLAIYTISYFESRL